MCKGEEGLKYWFQKRFNSAEHNSLRTGSEVIWGEKHGLGEKKGGGACRVCFDAAPSMIPDSGIYDLIGQIADFDKWVLNIDRCCQHYVTSHKFALHSVKNILIWQAKLPYWHVIDMCYRMIASVWMGSIKTNSTGSPTFFSLPTPIYFKLWNTRRTKWGGGGIWDWERFTKAETLRLLRPNSSKDSFFLKNIFVSLFSLPLHSPFRICHTGHHAISHANLFLWARLDPSNE